MILSVLVHLLLFSFLFYNNDYRHHHHAYNYFDDRSVGCTVIELLTGKPPYFGKPPMAALFSIVQVSRQNKS